jgi:hypothetical protein
MAVQEIWAGTASWNNNRFVGEAHASPEYCAPDEGPRRILREGKNVRRGCRDGGGRCQS